MQYDGLITLRQTSRVANGHFEGNTGSKSKKFTEEKEEARTHPGFLLK